jgi:hypothetical protein
MDVDESAMKGRERAMPTYKLRSDIEQKTDLCKVLEETVLDSHVDLTLRELHRIAKKEFHDTIVVLDKVVGRNSAGSQQYGGGVKKRVGAKRRSDLKEEASNLNQSEVGAKDTREWEREIGTKWNYH